MRKLSEHKRGTRVAESRKSAAVQCAGHIVPGLSYNLHKKFCSAALNF